ncbi:MAG: hypothetical protein FJ098_10905 [Deltaproteobacteria bacterium]|nr:hypothetical protein [Deltaproteobacteria bacterium]
MDRSHCLLDLQQQIRALRDRHKRNVEAVRKLGADLTPVENARFEVGTLLCLDLLHDLEEMTSCWHRDFPAYRATEEKILEEQQEKRLRPEQAPGPDRWEKLWQETGSVPEVGEQPIDATIQVLDSPDEVCLRWPDGSMTGLHWDGHEWRQADTRDTCPCDVGARDTL